MTGVVTFAVSVLKLLPAVKAGVQGAMEMMEWGREAVEAMQAEGRDPTDAEWDALNTRTAELREALHADD